MILQSIATIIKEIQHFYDEKKTLLLLHIVVLLPTNREEWKQYFIQL